MEASDHAAVADALAPDVVLYSPIIGPTFRGREAVGALFVGVLENIEDLRYTDELEGAETHALRLSRQLRQAGGDSRGVSCPAVAAQHQGTDESQVESRVPQLRLQQFDMGAGRRRAKERGPGLGPAALLVP
jgi:SnoaL-like domain